MRKHFFWLHHPDPLTREPVETRIELAIEGEPLSQAPLEKYIKERGLTKFRRRMSMSRMSDRVPVHYWYTPQSGDVIRCVLRSPMGADG